MDKKIFTNLIDKTESNISKKISKIIDELYEKETLSNEDIEFLINNIRIENTKYLFEKAAKKRDKYYGRNVFLRALIEVSNYCGRGCFYCGISNQNKVIDRYRLTKEEIMQSADIAVKANLKTIVMQGGEDPNLDPLFIEDVIKTIKTKYPEVRVTLSLGEQKKATYQLWKDAGADRYLLRHETIDDNYYKQIHSLEMSLKKRLKCLEWLKEIGYQTGSGIMIGIPGQTNENIIKDIIWFRDNPMEMIGIGPFIPHGETVFKDEPPGNPLHARILIAITRLMNPKALMPATTAMGTLLENGRELTMMAGANVMMPNVSPLDHQKKYQLYDNKKNSNDAIEDVISGIDKKLSKFGYKVSFSEGDYYEW